MLQSSQVDGTRGNRNKQDNLETKLSDLYQEEEYSNMKYMNINTMDAG